jgi:hypothetical protein
MYADWFVLLVQHDIFRANHLLFFWYDLFCTNNIDGACKLSGRDDGPS